MKTLPSSIFAIVVVLLGVGLMLLIGQPRLFFSRWSFTKSVQVTVPGEDRGYYYRFKAGYLYKGEPLDFDIVVGCRVKITTYKDNDRTVEVGVVPAIFGLKTRDQHGVAVLLPDGCNGETTQNGKVPKALLPLVVTYERADEPWSGVAYASEDAYDSPRSELKFLGATITRATREEWQAWRETEAKRNFITYELLGINPKNMWDAPKWKPGLRVMATQCFGISRLKLSDAVRDVVTPGWPSSKPAYWFADKRTQEPLWDIAMGPNKPPLIEGNRFQDYFPGVSPGHNGLARREPGAVIFFNRQVEGDVYPAHTDLSINRLEPSGELPAEMNAKERLDYSAAEIKPELRGFAFCDSSIVSIDGAPQWPPKYLYRNANRINGEAISEQLAKWGTNYFFAFERDEYIIFLRMYELASSFAKL
ncbi:hypothetical protein [Bradyrhizobium sp. BR13661]|jgi:hypothetical protein|uniref:hypothetical protein n=1 Tax=Bradyrhizobium sp. BR13661 TaxID=2940622 RepID=UPI002472EABB|nr:hypothetical protein [Bradyrhizobium sp. BR13661]MDH6259669.1 hypothetical protein [Bradyrhizobium sp. BR13661]